jgi:hypothetical protein
MRERGIGSATSGGPVEGKLASLLRLAAMPQSITSILDGMDVPLTLYSLYYNETRTHLGLGKDALLGRAVERSGTIVTTPILSDLHHRYARI